MKNSSPKPLTLPSPIAEVKMMQLPPLVDSQKQASHVVNLK